MELYYIWLECVKGLGPLSWHAILEEFKVVKIDREEIFEKGIGYNE